MEMVTGNIEEKLISLYTQTGNTMFFQRSFSTDDVRKYNSSIQYESSMPMHLKRTIKKVVQDFSSTIFTLSC